MVLMGDLELSADRRRELVELLDNEELLKAAYPKVAEYLDLAPHLAGTGNPETDADFEIRFLHYMIDNGSSPNPYWEIVAPLTTLRDGRRVLDGGNPEGAQRIAFAQMILQETFAYAVPSPETIKWVAGHCAGRRILEVGAGRGYWAAQLFAEELKIEAFDIQPPDRIDNPSFPRRGKHLQTWYEVQDSGQFSGRTQDESDSVLFMCWPPGWGDKMASESLSQFEALGGKRLIYIGEPKGGKTANDSFFSTLSAHWVLESEDSLYVSWWNLNDQAQMWTRKS
jgi:hypothetical protein